MRFFVFLALFISVSAIFSSVNVFSQDFPPEEGNLSEMEIILTLNRERFSPGDVIKIGGDVLRDGEPITGSVEIKLDDRYFVPLNSGRFRWESTLSGATKSGEREVIIEVTDEDGNSQTLTKKIYVIPIPTRLDIFVNGNSFAPRSTIKASAVLRDQNSEPIDTEVFMTLYDSNGATIMQRKFSGGNFEYTLPRDAVPGEWWVYAYSENIKERRFFSVEEYPKISVELKGEALKIKNVGNVHYTRPLFITFLRNGLSVTDKVSLNIGVGGEQILELTAPGDIYEIKVESGDYSNEFRDVSLTGGAIGVKGKFSHEQILLAAVILLLILAAAAFVKFRETLGKLAGKVGIKTPWN